MPEIQDDAAVIETPNEAEANANKAMQRLVDKACEMMAKDGQKLSQRAVIAKVREINPTGSGPTFNVVSDMIADWQDRQRRAEEMPEEIAAELAADTMAHNNRIYAVLEKHFARRRAEIEAELNNVRSYVDEVEAERDTLKEKLAAEEKAKAAAEEKAREVEEAKARIEGEVKGLHAALKLNETAEKAIREEARAEGYRQALEEAQKAAEETKKPARTRKAKKADEVSAETTTEEGKA